MDFFPLETGNQWVYRSAGATATVEVGERIQLAGKEYFIVTGAPVTPILYLRRDAEGRFFSYDGESKKERLYLNLFTDRAESAADPCAELSAVESWTAKVATPVGSFNTAALVHYENRKCADAGISADYFLPSVGLIRRVANTIAGPETYDLVYAKLGKSTVIAPPETSFRVALAPVTDRATEQDLMVRLTLRHTAEKPLELPFNSAQRFEIVVYDSNGQQVYTWSAAKVFPQIVWTEKISGERNWTELIPVKDLAAGRYVAQAWLTTSDGINFVAMAPFELP